MAEKRRNPRKKTRIVVDFDTEKTKTTGFTNDVSRSGLFVRTIRIPKIGTVLKAVLHLPDGKQVAVEGTVVRSFRAPTTLRSVLPSGFALRISRVASPEYDEFAGTL